MANVLTVLKLVPNESELEQDNFINNSIIPKCKEYEVELIKHDKEPLAFGMFAILIYIKNIDSEEGADKLNAFQEELENSDDLQSVELQHQTLIDY
jgi:translation elongation factor aEF-1 beta